MGEILQEVNISLLGGSTARVTAPYILNRPPKCPGRPRGKGSRGTAGNGLYPAPVYIPAILEPKTFWISKTATKSEFEEAA